MTDTAHSTEHLVRFKVTEIEVGVGDDVKKVQRWLNEPENSSYRLKTMATRTKDTDRSVTIYTLALVLRTQD